MAGDDTRTAATPDPWDIGFGVTLMVFALVAILVWFPNDISGSFIETNQVGRIGPGDAFFPVLLAGAILILSAIYVAGLFLRKSRQPEPSPGGRLTLADLFFLARFSAITLVSLGVMFVLGPVIVSAMNTVQGGEVTYRQLIDTAPYKYIGYVTGGCLLTLPLIAWGEGRLRPRSLLVVATVITASILIFDVLLSNVQLPPNADY